VGLKLVTAPANDPVSLAEAKAHLRVETNDEDLLIEAFVKAATEHVDGPRGFLGRALVDQTWDYYLDTFPSDCTGDLPIKLPLPPVIEVTGVFYQDSAGVEQTFSAASYTVDTYAEPARIVLTSSGSWPTVNEVANAVRVRFRAGYVDASYSPAVDAVPFSIRAAILLHVGDLYNNRESVVVGQTVATLPWAAEQLLRPHRHYLGLA
jgi:uncharacterized phiE125 gp8 family phage protein